MKPTNSPATQKAKNPTQEKLGQEWHFGHLATLFSTPKNFSCGWDSSFIQETDYKEPNPNHFFFLRDHPTLPGNTIAVLDSGMDIKLMLSKRKNNERRQQQEQQQQQGVLRRILGWVRLLAVLFPI